jgi:hypothetical protein
MSGGQKFALFSAGMAAAAVWYTYSSSMANKRRMHENVIKDRAQRPFGYDSSKATAQSSKPRTGGWGIS